MTPPDKEITMPEAMKAAKCLSESQMRQFLDECLGPPGAGHAAHIDSCPCCQTRLEAVIRGDGLEPRLEERRQARALSPGPPGPSPALAFGETPANYDTLSTPAPGVPSVERLAGYLVLEEIGRGGMGVVSKARSANGKVVALKRIREEHSRSPDKQDRFMKEANRLAGVRHNNVVRIHDLGLDELGGLYLAMEYLEGESLQGRLAREGRLPTHECLRVASAVAWGLSAIHEAGLIHRDLKPGNIHVGEGPASAVKVLDFGLARPEEDASGCTASGTVVGTPSYMAPEQAAGRRGLTQKADLYSLGAVLFHCLAGRPPLAADTAGEALAAVLRDEPPALDGLCDNLPPGLAKLVHELLAKDPAKRPATAREVAERLEKIGEVPVTPPPSWPLIWWIGPVAAVVVLTGVITFIIKHPSGKETTVEAPEGSKMKVEDGKVTLNLPDGDKLPGLKDRAATLEAPDARAGRVSLLRFVGTGPGARLLVSQEGTAARLWDVEGKKVLAEFSHPKGDSWQAAPSPDGKKFLGAGWHKWARLWDADGKLLGEFGRAFGDVEVVLCPPAFLPDGKHALLTHRGNARWDGPRLMLDGYQHSAAVVLWDLSGPKGPRPVRSYAHPGGQARALSLHPGGKRFLTGCLDGKARLWDVSSDKALAVFPMEPGFGRYLDVVEWSPKGDHFLTCELADSRTPSVKVWKLSGLKRERVACLELAPLVETEKEKLSDSFRCVAWSADCKRFAASTDTGRVVVWDCGSGRVVKEWRLGASARLALVPKGTRLLFKETGSGCSVRRAGSGEVVVEWKGGGAEPFPLAFTPDGKQLAVGDGKAVRFLRLPVK
jgi:serine/threonine protein kinase/WD40 repeat protein